MGAVDGWWNSKLCVSRATEMSQHCGIRYQYRSCGPSVHRARSLLIARQPARKRALGVIRQVGFNTRFPTNTLPVRGDADILVGFEPADDQDPAAHAGPADGVTRQGPPHRFWRVAQ